MCVQKCKRDRDKIADRKSFRILKVILMREMQRESSYFTSGKIQRFCNGGY